MIAMYKWSYARYIVVLLITVAPVCVWILDIFKTYLAPVVELSFQVLIHSFTSYWFESSVMKQSIELDT